MQASNKKDSILYQQKVITSKNISHRNIVGYALWISPNHSSKEYFSENQTKLQSAIRFPYSCCLIIHYVSQIFVKRKKCIWQASNVIRRIYISLIKKIELQQNCNLIIRKWSQFNYTFLASPIEIYLNSEIGR